MEHEKTSPGVDQLSGTADNGAVARLLGAAGRRERIPDEVAARVREAVHEAWLTSLAEPAPERSPRWKMVWMAAAASVIFAVCGWMTGGFGLFHREVVATVDAAEGVTRPVADRRSVIGSPTDGMVPGDEVRRGDVLKTASDARLALRMSGGASVRFDSETVAIVLSPSAVELRSGAVYVDSGPELGTAAPVAVHTVHGVAREIGTQYEVRLHGDRMTVRVRRGAVNFLTETDVYEASAGTELVVASDGGIERGSVAPSGPEWDWVLSIAPAFEIEGVTLGSYLSWVSHETGLSVEFPDRAAQRASSTIILHGSTIGMTPAESPHAVLPTCGFEHSVADGRLTVTRVGGRTGRP